MNRKNLPFRMLIVDDYAATTYLLCQIFEPNNWFLQTAASGKQCFDALQKQSFDLVLLDLSLPDMEGLVILEKIKSLYEDTEVIVFSGNADPQKVTQAMNLKAFDYIEKGGRLDINVLQSKVNRCYDVTMAKRSPLVHSNRGKRITVQVDVEMNEKSTKMIGESAAIQRVMKKIEKLAPFNIDILIAGENGTGKELVAQELHKKSKRSNGPFVAMSCAGLSENLLQSELFGHAKGAYTGSEGEKIGLIRSADGGTLFLDEIGEISLTMQSALLRVLETRKVIPMQSTKEYPVDIRIVSASNRKMLKGVEDGLIREDFYRRICQERIVVPALKSRKEDIPLLVAYFLEQTVEHEGLEPKTIADDAMELLVNRSWTGNIRELRSAIMVLACTSEENIIYKSDVEEFIEDMDDMDV